MVPFVLSSRSRIPVLGCGNWLHVTVDPLLLQQHLQQRRVPGSDADVQRRAPEAVALSVQQRDLQKRGSCSDRLVAPEEGTHFGSLGV